MKLWFVCFSLLPNFIIAQLPQDLILKKLTTADGLSQNVVNQILVDQRGFTWLSTYDGINRFDGSTCVSNEKIATGAADVRLCYSLVESTDGDIWFGTPTGVYCFSYRTNKFKKYNINLAHHALQSEDPVIYLTLAANHTYALVAINNTTYFLLNKTNGKINLINVPTTRQRVSDGQRVQADLEGLTDKLRFLINTDKHLLYYTLQKVKAEVYEWHVQQLPLAENMAWAQLEVSADSNLIVSNGNSQLWQYQLYPVEVKPIHLPISSAIQMISAKNENEIWIATREHGIVVYHLKEKKLMRQYQERAHNPYSLGSNYVISLYHAPNDMVWISTWGEGVQFGSLQPPLFSHHFTDLESKLAGVDNFIRGFGQATDGNFYANTLRSGVLQLDSNLYFQKIFSSGSYSNVSVSKNKKQVLYGFDQLHIYNVEAQTFANHAVPPTFEAVNKNSADFYHFQDLGDGQFLAAGVQGVMHFNNTSGHFSELPVIDENCPMYHVFAHQDRHGGIISFSKNRETEYLRFDGKYYKTSATLPNKARIIDVYEENDSLLWLATSNGLMAFNPLTLKTTHIINENNGLPSPMVYAVVPDTLGNLWLSTGRGLCMVNKKSLYVKRFDGYAGQQGKEYNSHTAAVMADGRIIFGGTDGFTMVRPWLGQLEAGFPRVQFTHIQSKEAYNPFAWLHQDSVLKLPVGNNALEIGFVGIDYINAPANTFKYRLAGYNNNWQVTANPGRARFLALDPGNYFFELMVANEDGTWSTEIKTLHITIAAPWWQQWWFKIVVFLLFITSIVISIKRYIAYQLYKKQVEIDKQLALVQERERITADLHDDIGATLSSMHIYGDLAASVLSKQPQRSFEMFGKVTELSQELMLKMNDIVWSLKSSLSENNTIGLRLKNYCQELLICQNIEVEFQISQDIDTIINNPNARKNILLIAKEALNNIAKYSKATAAVVKLYTENNHVLLQISDNGIGMDEANIKKGNGLDNMAQRCLQLKGTHTCKTGIDKGVTHIFRFGITTIRHS